jgi:hypothetical protein
MVLRLYTKLAYATLAHNRLATASSFTEGKLCSIESAYNLLNYWRVEYLLTALRATADWVGGFLALQLGPSSTAPPIQGISQSQPQAFY